MAHHPPFSSCTWATLVHVCPPTHCLFRYQKATNSLERDETYMPLTRKDFKLPDAKVAVRMDYAEVLEETPAFTLFKLFIRQFL